ncbi:Cupredoxin [Polyplosphaeria fusca]|uniref:Cupredoxin n=1 Tax=Polyplosphaeria fusca TaxID=682080 RepID=A0A9P4R6J6_9PLEO|nr:Cupredoxin [Polyplosphaeria fusca]
MHCIGVGKAFLISLLFATLSYAENGNSSPSTTGIAFDSNDTPSPTGGSFIPNPSGNWISPPYRWFFQYPLPIAPIHTPTLTWTDAASNAAIDFYEVEVKAFQKQIYPDLPATEMVGYNGLAPGPMFVMQQGREAVVRYTNNGPTNVSVHVHGQYDRAPFDGWAGDFALPGQYKDYYYPNAQNARTIWYHDHTEFHTGENAYKGQEGFYLLRDSHEQSLGLPSGDHDVTLMFGSKTYNQDGSLNYDTNNGIGLWGDVISVNAQPWPYFEVEPRKYRLRLLNGAISRTFSLSFVPDGPSGFGKDPIEFDVIGSDSGLLSHPVRTDGLAFSMGERYEIVIDFAGYEGQNITVHNVRGMGENIDYAATDFCMRFVVGYTVVDDSNNGDVPQELRYIPPPPDQSPSKEFAFTRTDDGEWVINGVGWSDIENRILTRPERGDDEIWTLTNGGGNGTHPVHIHLVDFQVLSRTGGRNEVLPYESAGEKDVVWLAGGETVQVVARYAPWPGVYMFHCHNLVHEDNDMLVAFNVSQLAEWGYSEDTQFIDPMTPEFRPKDVNPDDYTTAAIMAKLAWFYSTNAYNRGNVEGVYSELEAYSAGNYGQESSTSSSQTFSNTATPTTPTTLMTFVSSTTTPPESVLSATTPAPYTTSLTILPPPPPTTTTTTALDNYKSTSPQTTAYRGWQRPPTRNQRRNFNNR